MAACVLGSPGVDRHAPSDRASCRSRRAAAAVDQPNLDRDRACLRQAQVGAAHVAPRNRRSARLARLENTALTKAYSPDQSVPDRPTDPGRQQCLEGVI